MRKITDEEAIKSYEERVVKPLKAAKKEVKVVTIREGFVVEQLSPREILEHMKAKDAIGRRHIEIEKRYLRYLRRKKKRK